jgi:4-hydroxy-tetrahydrodipicolinate reductase
MVRIVVSGALGRMGRRIIELAEKDPAFRVVGKVEKDAHPELGIVDSLDKVKGDYDCIIEFTTIDATMEHVRAAEKQKKAMVIGTTGLTDAEVGIIRKAGRGVPIVLSPNMSVGVNIFLKLIDKTAGVVGKDYKARIEERHHAHKRDKPSGTAKLMASIVKEKLGGTNIPIESVREGEIVGDHDMIFESVVDTLKISHSAKTRDIFALGALRAAKFIAKKKKGFFSMSDVLGLGEI